MPNKPTVCLACLFNDDDEQFMDRFRDMAEYDWINAVVTMRTDCSSTTGTTGCGPNDTTTHFTQRHFGRGFDKQPADGGFHELKARNELLRFAEGVGCDWTLLADPDELFRDETFAEIQVAHRTRKDVIWFECYHFCSPTQYLWWESQLHPVHDARRKLHDPHARAVRASARKRYVPNINNKFRDGLRNHTMHCHIQPQVAREVHIAYGIYHVHTRHMYDPKRPAPERLAKMPKKVSPFTLPQRYVDSYVPQ